MFPILAATGRLEEGTWGTESESVRQWYEKFGSAETISERSGIRINYFDLKGAMLALGLQETGEREGMRPLAGRAQSVGGEGWQTPSGSSHLPCFWLWGLWK